MTHGVGSSSVSGSSAAAQQSKVFDIANEAGLLALLREIHRSDHKQASKNELRDLLFDFKNGDGSRGEFVKRALADAGFTVEIDAVATASLPNPEPEPESVAEVKQSFGRARSAPKFSATTPTAASPISPPAASEPPKPKVEPEPEVASTPEPQEPKTDPTPVPVAPPENAKPTEVPAEVPTKAEPATLPVTPPPPPESVAAPEGGAAMERIKEIKRLVNEKVGNPVTLIDINNQIGREYMNALLGAMKVINGGRPNDLKAAMERLEKAYQAAITIAENAPPPETVTDSFVDKTNTQTSVADTKSATPSAPPPTPPVSPPVVTAAPPTPPAATPPISSAPQPAVTPLNSAAQTPNSPAAPVTPPPVIPPPANAAPPVKAPEPSPVPPAGNPVKINVSNASADAVERASQDSATPPIAAPSAPAPVPPTNEPAQSVPIMSKLAAVESALKSDVVEPPQQVAAAPTTAAASAAPTPPAAAPDANSTRLMSVAKEEQLQNLMRQNQAEEAQQKQAAVVAERANSDPLMLPEVTAGLKQLLSEWGLFKGSGFFGTGPSGIDHPLYQKIANLTMAAVIAGRFEGATPDVKQSITDYMNGWRYEEGIVHEHTETFEHYLRRVIRHILDQKKVGGV